MLYSVRGAASILAVGSVTQPQAVGLGVGLRLQARKKSWADEHIEGSDAEFEPESEEGEFDLGRYNLSFQEKAGLTWAGITLS